MKADIKKLYEQYVGVILCRSRKIVHTEEDAWDVTQESFIKLMKHYDSIQNKQAILAWLLRTSMNCALSLLRKKTEVSYEETEFYKDVELLKEENKIMNKVFLQKILKKSDQKSAELAVYAFIDGYKYYEIAELMDMGESTVRKHLTLFKKRAQDKWGDDYGKK